MSVCPRSVRLAIFRFVCCTLIWGGSCFVSDLTAANRTREQLLEGRARVAADMEIVAFKRIPDVITKRRNERGRLERDRKVDYLDLRLSIVRPPPAETEAGGAIARPAVLFFHGGGFQSGSPEQFFLQAKYFAARGAVAFCVEYRLKDRVEVTIAQQVIDARSALRWVRENAAALQIDPRQVIAAGGSAGGYLALASAVLPHSDSIEVPDAVVLYNPAIDFERFVGDRGRGRLEDSIGGTVEQFSSTPNLRAGLPPIIIFQGEEDEKTPLVDARNFTERAHALELRCELVTFQKVGHGFHNRDPYIEDCAQQAVNFLRDEGFALGQ
ncbi:alpha/beta hydrolase [Synoicihabitans lomoniglobus]|uniref:Alpha/beta hydrolase n=1 Tax=Synoicihabitans lomoniglobus TaxID=2909285 RepID=A0AAE9ZZA0_9BACT|nr:alpha/beta hydrolase [Opitutaceae bacterium LMO-M01]WED64093.1 alpha/beta hydrolase [Opitutaceae bacterium LMO-M01]